MTTIHTIEDLLRVLDENPDWVEALRTRLLSHELLELPQKFTQFVAEMHSFVAEMHSFVAEMHSFVEATNRRFDALETQVEALKKDVGTLKEDVSTLKKDVSTLKKEVGVLQEDVSTLKKDVSTLKEDVSTLKKDVSTLKKDVSTLKEDVSTLKKEVGVLQEDVGTLKEDVGTLKTQVRSIQTDLGILKGSHARTAALREATSIAREMGLRRTKTLTQDDLWMMTDQANTSIIPANELKSYRRADLIMEATDSDGDPCYIAVEISFTANGRDTRRAMRNAKLLTEFTGRRSYPAVAGLRRDDRIQDLIKSGTVFWYQLDPDVLEAE